MRQLHWIAFQQEMVRFPVPIEWKNLIASGDSGLAIHNLEAHFRSIVKLKPMPGADMTKLAALQNEVSGVCHAMAVFRTFGMRGVQIYKIANEFGEALADLECNVAPRYLKFDGEVVCIEFPDSIEFDMGDGQTARCAYVVMHRATSQVPIFCDGVPQELMMDLTVPLYRGDVIEGQDNIKLYLTETSPLNESLAESISWVREEGRTGFTEKLLAYIVNCLLYINSGDPDLRHLRPDPKPKNAKAIKRWRRSGRNLPVPITLVGFDYKKPKEYRVGEAFVKSHRRWQPCGPGLSQVKLIWVREHTRHFKKDETIVNTEHRDEQQE